jgi:nitrogen-specific signal transduction histidine kinase
MTAQTILNDSLDSILLNALLSTIQSLVMVTDGNTDFETASILRVNHYFELVTGLTEKQMMTLSMTDLIDDEDKGVNLKNLRDIYKNRQAADIVLPLLNADKDVMLIEFHVQAIKNNDQTAQWLWIGAPAKAQSYLDDVNVLAEQLNATTSLTRATAHDLNNVLAIIMGNNDILLANNDPNSQFYTLLQTISRATHKGVTLTQTLLSLNEKPQASIVIAWIN